MPHVTRWQYICMFNILFLDCGFGCAKCHTSPDGSTSVCLQCLNPAMVAFDDICMRSCPIGRYEERGVCRGMRSPIFILLGTIYEMVLRYGSVFSLHFISQIFTVMSLQNIIYNFNFNFIMPLISFLELNIKIVLWMFFDKNDIW